MNKWIIQYRYSTGVIFNYETAREYFTREKMLETIIPEEENIVATFKIKPKVK